ncbi:MAG: dienelactone hydrolase family protein [Gemmatimonadota bacterium]
MRIPGLALLAMLFAWPAHGQAQQPRLLSPPDAPEVRGELVTPATPGRHPAVILLHGSAGWRTEYIDIARAFADSGFVALVLDYYAGTGGAPIGSAEKLRKWEIWRRTVRNAADYLRSLPSVAGGRIALVGYSRGAFLAVSVGASIPSVVAVVDYFGGGGGGILPLAEEVKGLPPLLILHGQDDRIVPVSFARELRDAAVAAGVPVEMRLFPGQRHAFNAPWSPTYSERAARKAFAVTIAFLRARFQD